MVVKAEHNKKELQIRPIKERLGAVTLLFCLLVGISSTILLACFEAALLRTAEADVIRAARAAADNSLAKYDLDLLEDFALWGVELEQVSDYIFHEMIDEKLGQASLSLYPHAYTLDNQHLSDQITTYMQIRAPLNWVNDLTKNLELVASVSSSPNLSPATSSGNYTSHFNIDEIKGLQKEIQKHMTKVFPHSIALGVIKECLDYVFSPTLESLQNAVLNTFKNKVEEMFAGCLPIYPSDFAVNADLLDGYVPDFLDPDTITSLAKMADNLLKPVEQPYLRQLFYSEYCLSFFPAQVTFQLDKNSGERIELRTPYGVPHQQLENKAQKLNGDEQAEASIRENEVERIITGETCPQKAAQRIKGNIIILRAVIRLLETLANEKRLNSYRTTANLISALLAAVSAGTVYVEPETIVWILAMADSIKMANEDTNALLAGKSVALWQQEQVPALDFYYHDYLRLFLLVKPADELLTAINGQIKEVLPGEYVYALNVETSFKGSTCSFVAGFYNFNHVEKAGS